MRKNITISQIACLFILVLTVVSCGLKPLESQSDTTNRYLDSLEVLFSNVPDWLATVYDEKSGGFCHNALMVNDPLYGPDMQSTCFALIILSSGNIIQSDSISESFKTKMLNYVTSRFDEETKLYIDPEYKVNSKK